LLFELNRLTTFDVAAAGESHDDDDDADAAHEVNEELEVLVNSENGVAKHDLRHPVEEREGHHLIHKTQNTHGHETHNSSAFLFLCIYFRRKKEKDIGNGKWEMGKGK
jgi:hypothetical protein